MVAKGMCSFEDKGSLGRSDVDKAPSTVRTTVQLPRGWREVLHTQKGGWCPYLVKYTEDMSGAPKGLPRRVFKVADGSC